MSVKRAADSESGEFTDRSPAGSPAFTSLAAFGRRHGRGKSTATKWKREGLLVMDDAGRVDVEKSDAALVAAGRIDAAPEPPAGTSDDAAAADGDSTDDTPAPDGTDPALDALAERLASGALLTTAEAERVKQNYLARLRHLEYERQAQRLCDVDTVAREVGDRLNRVRHRLLALPQSVPPRVMACTRHQDVQQVIFEEVRAALEDLSGGQEVADKTAQEEAG